MLRSLSPEPGDPPTTLTQHEASGVEIHSGVALPVNFTLLNSEETIARLVAIIRDAKESVVLISPYVTMGAEDRVGRAVREALARGVKVVLVTREDDQTPLTERTAEILLPLIRQGLSWGTVPGLHAKLYFSESAALVTSLNLLSSSFLNTIEVGLVSDDKDARDSVRQFVKRDIEPYLQAPSTGMPLAKWLEQQQRSPARDASRSKNSVRTERRQRQQGHCIRCRTGIPLNPMRPYCSGCFAEWAEWENEDYRDNHCHACGDEFRATMRKPLCRDCFGPPHGDDEIPF